jgi:hypothetical protein
MSSEQTEFQMKKYVYLYVHDLLLLQKGMHWLKDIHSMNINFLSNKIQ